MRRINRRTFLAAAIGGIAASSAVSRTAAVDREPERPNILLITADDMNWDTPGCFGGDPADVTPNIDRLASEGIRFEHAHVTIAVCMPSREALMTGRYPHRNGGMGFEPIRQDVPTLQEQLDRAGYMNGILGKCGHLQPAEKFKWSTYIDRGELGAGRDPDLYYRATREFLKKAGQEKKPFFLMANSHDPHRPFSGSADEAAHLRKNADFPWPSKTFKEDEIQVPGFLADLPDVRKEVAQYLSSCRRCDDTVGAVLKALRESGQEENTLVMFLSDNGMAFPFAKTNCYLHSTRTPWIVRWPGRVSPGTVDSEHIISGIDFMPTILEAAGLRQIDGMDGKSFLPLIFGKKQENRDRVFTVFHQTSARRDYPMRCVQDRQFGYIFNAWADGETVFRNESQSGLTMNAMSAAAETDKRIAERVKLFLYRVPEELYDFRKDPDALVNLVNDERYNQKLVSMREELLDWMERTDDPLAPVFKKFVKGAQN